MHGPTKIAVFLALAVSCVPPILSNPAFGHGDAPSTCENRYDAEIMFLSIDNGTQTFDPMTESDLELQAQTGAGYDVTFTLRTANMSSLNNTLAGSTWYRNTAFGFGNGVCVNDAGSDKDITITVHVEVMPGVPDGYTQNGVEWGAWPDGSQVRYDVVWHNATDAEPAEELPETPQQTNQTGSEQPLPPQINDDEPHESENDAKESEDDEPTGVVYSPFVFKGESASVSITTEDEIEELLLQTADSLYVNGTLASYHYIAGQLHILSGNWSIAMNDTAVYDFAADFTMIQSDGLDRKTYSLANLTAVDDLDLLDEGSIALTGALDFANGTTAMVNATITVVKLNVVQIQLDSLDTPIYGVVDKILRTENGETQVMARQFDMI